MRKWHRWLSKHRWIRASLFTAFILSLFAGLSISRQIIYSRHQKAASRLPNPLYVQTDGETGPYVVLLHGLTASHRYWEGQTPELSREHRVVSVDLLGFGRSPWPDVSYSSLDHLKPLAATMDSVIPAKEKFVLIGHSLGAILALSYTVEHPDRVSKLILMSPPLFQSLKEARRMIRQSSVMESIMSMNSVVAPAFCYLHDSLGPAVIPLFRPFMKNFPEHVIEDAALHTWKSFNGSLENVVVSSHVLSDLQTVKDKNIIVILGEGDKDQSHDELEKIKAMGIRVQIVLGSHNFPLEHRDETNAALLKEIK